MSVKISLELKGLEKLISSLTAKAEIINETQEESRVPSVIMASTEFAVQQYSVEPFTTPAEEAEKEKNAADKIAKELADKIDSV